MSEEEGSVRVRRGCPKSCRNKRKSNAPRVLVPMGEKWPTVNTSDATKRRERHGQDSVLSPVAVSVERSEIRERRIDGKFPRDIVGLMKIPGLDPNAGARGSIAFGIREALPTERNEF